MIYINTKTLEYPINFTELKSIYKNVAFSTPPNSYGDHAKVFDGIVPKLTENQYAEEGAPKMVDGQYQRTWVVYNYTDEQIEQRSNAKFLVASRSIRAERDKLLSKSDWTQLADAPVDKTAWATYRQQLRDITGQDTFPTKVTWPTKP